MLWTRHRSSAMPQVPVCKLVCRQPRCTTPDSHCVLLLLTCPHPARPWQRTGQLATERTSVLKARRTPRTAPRRWCTELAISSERLVGWLQHPLSTHTCRPSQASSVLKAFVSPLAGRPSFAYHDMHAPLIIRAAPCPPSLTGPSTQVQGQPRRCPNGPHHLGGPGRQTLPR